MNMNSKNTLIGLLILLVISLPVTGKSIAQGVKQVIEEIRDPIEIEKVIERPEVVADQAEFERQARTEVFPDLSTSTVTPSPVVVKPGEQFTYVISLVNTGNVQATGLDVFNELDGWFNNPTDYQFTNCGEEVADGTGGEHVELSNVNVGLEEPCEIRYKVRLNLAYGGNGVGLANDLYISPAAEGGVEIGPIPAAELTVNQPGA